MAAQNDWQSDSCILSEKLGNFNFILPKVNTDYIRQAQVMNTDNWKIDKFRSGLSFGRSRTQVLKMEHKTQILLIWEKGKY